VENKARVIKTMEIIKLVKAGHAQLLTGREVRLPKTNETVRNHARQMALALAAMEELIDESSPFFPRLQEYSQVVAEYTHGRGRPAQGAFAGLKKEIKINKQRGSIHVTHIGEYLGLGKPPYEDKRVLVEYLKDPSTKENIIQIKKIKS
jgi:hypothetical protein